MKILTKADEILLLAILRLKENAYGTTIIKEIKNKTGKELSFGSLWVSLDTLCQRGLLKKRLADATPIRGGRKKIYYTLTTGGVEALNEARLFHQSLWQGAAARLKKYKQVK
jgi:DNA-binding PadR family transcriptional regulator